MYQSNTMLSAPFNTMKISAATDMTKSLKPKKKQGRIFTEI